MFLAKFFEEVYFKQTYLGVLSKEKEGDFTKGSSLIFMWRLWMLSTVHLLGNVQHEVKHNVNICRLWEKNIFYPALPRKICSMIITTLVLSSFHYN